MGSNQGSYITGKMMMAVHKDVCLSSDIKPAVLVMCDKNVKT